MQAESCKYISGLPEGPASSGRPVSTEQDKKIQKKQSHTHTKKIKLY